MNYIYSPLLTDFYQLTMAYGYYQLGMHNREAVFHLFFRSNPFKGNYALACGLTRVIDYIKAWRFSEDDLDYLSTLKNKDEFIFSKEFIDYLSSLRFSGDIDAIPEGTIVFANTPLIRIKAPLLQCQLLETALLNIVNFQTLIATKASRVVHAASGDEVIEFGMRRAQGPDGALAASQAAYIGGCVATSNTLAGKYFDIPVRGTHAHSWVSAFPDELAAFFAYAKVMPNNCLLLVDTYDTLAGVQNAITVGESLQKQGGNLLGIRLDSGDIATLSIQARKMLDEAGFKKSIILASNTLDEYLIRQFKAKGAKITAWGVGTQLATAYDCPALDGVYKIAAIQDEHGEWLYKLKISEQSIKISNPGMHQVRRFFYNENYILDMVYDVELGTNDFPTVILMDDKNNERQMNDYDAFVDLLEPIFRKGKLIGEVPSIHEVRKDAMIATKIFYENIGDKPYPVGLEKKLYLLREDILKKHKQ